ncbi:hypothetical protein DLJ53_17875 [Acuticoccus sediminis]|uniref:Uncharacterized protein n=2 Tax=Acuticoccus sediminis TaxID=2184697 RepID=A0A8B2NUV9_9HYPH|nr:hypothetical protein DLJ53_17875 [Acuticoccus sediminis]
MAGALALACTPAAAADFAPVVNVFTETLATIVASAVGAGMLWLIAKAGKTAEKYGVKVDQEALNAAAARLEIALERKLRAELGSRLPGTIDFTTKSEVVNRLVDYAAEQLPDGLKVLGMTADNVRRLAHEMVEDWTGGAEAIAKATPAPAAPPYSPGEGGLT